MRDFFIVLKFELLGFFKNKSFIISTIIISLLLAIGLSFPTIKDAFSNLSNQRVSEDESEEDLKRYGIVDENSIILHMEGLENDFVIGKLIPFNNRKDLEDQVNEGQLEAGYILTSDTSYEYIIKNNDMLGGHPYILEEILTNTFRINEFKARGIDYSKLDDLIHPDIKVETKILGKDSASNYFYTYMLVFSLYFIIILYGQLIATSVASEKSNRTMEVLVTSTKSSNLIFGKVIGVALAGIIQFGLFLLTGFISYKLNGPAWDHALDFIFKIPGDILLSFAAFGILGYLFYAFIFGALGALVSRTEDVSASSTPILILFIGVFMVSILGMQNTSGILLKIASFLPFSSFMAMFIRISMGSVTILEIITSFTILTLSTGLMGLLGSRIYRAGTLMYGNRVKLKDVFKLLKSE